MSDTTQAERDELRAKSLAGAELRRDSNEVEVYAPMLTRLINDADRCAELERENAALRKDLECTEQELDQSDRECIRLRAQVAALETGGKP